MIDEETKQIIEAMAKAQNKKMSVLIKEVFEELYDQCSDLTKAIMCVAGHSGSVTFAFSGKSTLIFGTAKTDEEVRQQIGEKFKLNEDRFSEDFKEKIDKTLEKRDQNE